MNPRCANRRAADFPPGVPQSARDGTRKNMLSEALLDGEKYPDVRLRATDVVAAGDGYDVGVEISIKDQVRTVRVPVRLTRTDGALTASGEFPLKQSDLGFKPFSIAMGALVVIDEMKIRFERHRTRVVGTGSVSVCGNGACPHSSKPCYFPESSASSASAAYTFDNASRMIAGCTATERFFTASNQYAPETSGCCRRT